MKVSSRLWGYVLKVISGLFILVFLTQYQSNWEISEGFRPKLNFYPMKMLRNLLWVVLSKTIDLSRQCRDQRFSGSSMRDCDSWMASFLYKRETIREWLKRCKKSTKNHMEWNHFWMCQMDNSLALSQFRFFFFFTSRPKLTELCFWSLERKCKQIFKKKDQTVN
jgi:hypothetical protein